MYRLPLSRPREQGRDPLVCFSWLSTMLKLSSTCLDAVLFYIDEPSAEQKSKKKKTVAADLTHGLQAEIAKQNIGM